MIMNIEKESSKLKKNKKVRVFKYFLGVITGLVAVILIVATTAVYIVFTPERITPIVMRYANEYLNARLSCESVELTFFSTFPKFGIRLQNGSVVNVNDSLSTGVQDTLLCFNDCSISFNPLALYKKNHLIVNYARLYRPTIYLHVSAEGKNNWDIFPSDSSAVDSATKLPDITVKRISIVDANVAYDNRQQLLFVATDSLQLRAKGTSTDINLSLSVQALTTLFEEKSYTSKLPFSLSAHVLSDKAYQSFNIERSVLSIGFMDFDLRGNVLMDTANSSANVELWFKLHASSFADLMTAIPEHVLDMRDFGFSGSLDFSGTVNGILGADQYPACAVSLQVNEASIVAKQNPRNPILQKMEIDCRAVIDLMNNVPSFIDIKNVDLQNSAAKLHVSGLLNNLFTQPFVEMKINGGVDLKSFWQSMFFDRGMTAEGSLAADIAGRFFLDDLFMFNFGKINLTGSMDVDQVRFNYPEEGIDLFAPLAKIRFGSNVVDSVRGRSVSSLLRANVDVDSLYFRWNDRVALRAGQLFASFRTSEPKDSTTIVEMSAFARLNNMQLRTSDSIRLRATKISTFARLSPFSENPSQPEWTARISMDSIRGRTPDLGGRIDSTVLSLKFHPRKVIRRQLSSEDSIRRRSRIDSMIVANRNSSVLEFQLSEGEAKQILSQWDVSGSFISKSIRVMTPYFPLRTHLSRSSATFTHDNLSIKHTRLQAGGSDMMLSGEIEGIRRALLYNGRITANISTKIDSLDCNEIIKALAAGSVYSSQSEAERDSISSIVLNNDSAVLTDSVSGVFVVPRNIDMELDASMNQVKYGRLNIDQANGKIIIRNRSVRIPDLKVKSDIGNADFSMVYKAPTTKGAYTGMDIHMEKVQLKELINSIPMLDSLTPMMRSFEGLAECNIIAVTELDSLSNLIIPRTTASCYISGKNMVLLDGETFSNIAKKLYFKNKGRNVIDSISVDMALADGKISVFPFVLSIDRYVAAIGGTQNLDLSFQYHISILKWPVPLVKIGLNIWGNPDDIHYGIASRKYENLMTPVKEKSLEPIIFNLRRQLHDGLRQSIDNILNESSTMINRRILPDMENDSVQTLFEVDTTNLEVSPVVDSLDVDGDTDD
jgi:hypothetical protein